MICCLAFIPSLSFPGKDQLQILIWPCQLSNSCASLCWSIEDFRVNITGSPDESQHEIFLVSGFILKCEHIQVQFLKLGVPTRNNLQLFPSLHHRNRLSQIKSSPEKTDHYHTFLRGGWEVTRHKPDLRALLIANGRKMKGKIKNGRCICFCISYACRSLILPQTSNYLGL